MKNWCVEKNEGRWKSRRRSYLQIIFEIQICTRILVMVGPVQVSAVVILTMCIYIIIPNKFFINISKYKDI